MPTRYAPPPVLPKHLAWPREAAVAVAVLAMTVLLGAAAERWLDFRDVALLFVTAVIFVSVRSGLGVSVCAAVLAFGAYNFFFIAPRYTFYVAGPQGTVTLATFLVAALVCERLANRLRAQLLVQQASHADSDSRHALALRLAAADDVAEAVRATVEALRVRLQAEVVVVLVDDADGALRDPLEPGGTPRFDPVLRVAAEQALARAQGAPRRGDDDLDRLAWRAWPLQLDDVPLGVACVRFDAPLTAVPVALGAWVEAVLRDLAQALLRLRLAAQLAASRRDAETEGLRAALLSSVSHDLRSPLAAIVGSAESLALYGDRISASDRQALAESIVGEGRRLDGYIQNLLDMTRLGHGRPDAAREWLDLDEVCGAAAARVRRQAPATPIELRLPRPAPLLRAHPALLEQALVNLLDNAVRFSPPDEPVVLAAGTEGDWLHIDVCDRGPGIPATMRERVFEPFVTDDRGDPARRGTGLGLGIARGILTAHGGTVQALPGADGRGSCLRVTLPCSTPPAAQPDD